jgi:hypothetical protein
MPSYPIVQKSDCACEVANDLELPAFYMEDFSVLGFRVDNCGKAEQILSQAAFVFKRKKKTLTISIERAAQIHEVFTLLNNQGIECEIADVADGMYQG